MRLLALLFLRLAQPGQSEFIPIDQLPPADQLPAAPLLIAAYAFVWVAVLFYLLALWRRLGKVERELRDLGRQVMQKRP
jgi:CcmD family protein